jgi:hypothetical protein
MLYRVNEHDDAESGWVNVEADTPAAAQAAHQEAYPDLYDGHLHRLYVIPVESYDLAAALADYLAGHGPDIEPYWLVPEECHMNWDEGVIEVPNSHELALRLRILISEGVIRAQQVWKPIGPGTWVEVQEYPEAE